MLTRRATTVPSSSRPTARRERDELERRMRHAARWLRSFRSRRSVTR